MNHDIPVVSVAKALSSEAPLNVANIEPSHLAQATCLIGQDHEIINLDPSPSISSSRQRHSEMSQASTRTPLLHLDPRSQTTTQPVREESFERMTIEPHQFTRCHGSTLCE